MAKATKKTALKKKACSTQMAGKPALAKKKPYGGKK